MAKVKPRIIADSRESRLVKRVLTELESQVVEKAITPADYVLSAELAVERKRFRDFLRSVFDGRLFEQAERLTEAYEKPVLVVEGDIHQGLSEMPNPLVFWGALAKVISEWNLSVIFTLNERQTAMLLHSLARKSQEERKRIAVKHKPKAYTLKEKQLFAVCGLPRIGPERAERLLKKFGSVRRIFIAKEKELLSTEGLGKKIVAEVRELLDTKYPALENS